VKKARVKKVLGDRSYGSHENFDFLASEGIEPCIKVRRDSLLSCGGVRGEVVREDLKDPTSLEGEVRLWAKVDGIRFLFWIQEVVYGSGSCEEVWGMFNLFVIGVKGKVLV